MIPVNEEIWVHFENEKRLNYVKFNGVVLALEVI